MARISVLIPCFNHGQFVADAIASVRAQTFTDSEIIIVDDGSTDPKTVDVLSNLREPGVTVLRTPNRGLPAARNHAARHASGSIFCSLDADDRLHPSWFEKALAVLDAQPDVAFVSHWLETFGDERWTWTPQSCDLPALLARNTVNGAALVRRDAFEAVNGYEESMRSGCEDWDFWLRLVERGYRGHIIPEVLFHYRRDAASMSRVMIDPAAYRAPLATLVARHRDAYRSHLIDVLVSKEAESLHLLEQVATMQRDMVTSVEPALARAEEELKAVEAKVTRLAPAIELAVEHDRLAGKVGELEREVAAYRSSWSWTLTAPLRYVYALLTGSTRR
jgi:glycosyltransferase involved in cell wall biosynthesis